MYGTFRFYEDGELICASRNLITTEGAAHILRYFVGGARSVASAIGVGAGTTAAAVGNTALEFEVDREDVILASPDFLQEHVVYKARLPQGLIVNIREAGLFTELAALSDGMVLLKFIEEELWDVGTFVATNARIGGNALRLTGTSGGSQTSVTTGLGLDLSAMSTNQVFKLAAYVGDSNCDSIVIRFGTDASNYYAFTIASPASGYGVFSLTKSAGAATGSPDWSNITQITVIVDAEAAVTTDVDLDGLRVEQSDLVDPNNILVARTVLSTPVSKTAEKTMDIEYELAVGAS